LEAGLGRPEGGGSRLGGQGGGRELAATAESCSSGRHVAGKGFASCEVPREKKNSREKNDVDPNLIFLKLFTRNSCKWSFFPPNIFWELQNYMIWGGKNRVLLEMLL
jgi:hypothetical protein